MASIQEIETNVLVLMDKMDFLLRALPITLQIQGKLLRKDGQPGLEMRKTNMAELYKLAKSGTGDTTMIPAELPAEPAEELPPADPLIVKGDN
jgi:hypothetical protein